ncbi:MAG: ATP-binding protein [Armatimonadetes bacterium]|nr:ATP-binding protein [Armatimonadota bacterium]MDW8154094.1 ATP-binding protein [Armatimonadota bacterium]
MRAGIGWKILAGYLAVSFLVGLAFGLSALATEWIADAARNLDRGARLTAAALSAQVLAERQLFLALQGRVFPAPETGVQFELTRRLAERALDTIPPQPEVQPLLVRIRAAQAAFASAVRAFQESPPAQEREAVRRVLTRFAELRRLLRDLAARTPDPLAENGAVAWWLAQRWLPDFFRQQLEHTRHMADHTRALLDSYRWERAFWVRCNALLALALDPATQPLSALPGAGIPTTATWPRVPEAEPLLAERAAAMGRFEDFVQKALARYRTGGSEAYAAFLRSALPAILEDVLALSTSLRAALEVERTRFQSELERVNASILAFTRSLTRAAILALLLGLLTATVLTRSITRPLDALAAAMDRVRRNDLEVRLDAGRRRDEVGRMVEVFNVLVRELRESRERLRAYQEDLERMVAERTQQLERTQARLVQSEKLAALGQLVAGVAHELNNPLTSVLGYAQLLEAGELEGEDARRALGIVLQEADRARRIVQNLLTFARQQAHERGPVDVNAALEQTVALRRYELERAGVEFVLDLAQDLPPIEGDLYQLQQVFLNLINNAAQALAGGRGRIEIRTTHREGRVVVEVADTGPGIPPEHLHRIFDPFFTTKDPGQGTGLGLSISYGIVRDHGGEIYADNRLEGGARFVIELPVAAPSS